MSTDFNHKDVARSLYKDIQDRFVRPGWSGYHDVHTLNRLYIRLANHIEQTGGDPAFLDETGQASGAEMKAAIEALFEKYYLKYVELVEPALDREHVTHPEEWEGSSLATQLKGLSQLRTAFEKSGKAAAHIDPLKFNQRLVEAETRFRQEAAALTPGSP